MISGGEVAELQFPRGKVARFTAECLLDKGVQVRDPPQPPGGALSRRPLWPFPPQPLATTVCPLSTSFCLLQNAT